MRMRRKAIASIIAAVCLVCTVLFASLPRAAAVNSTAPRVIYKIVSNSATPAITRGSNFEAIFGFYDNNSSSVKNIKVESPNNSISGLPKTFDAENPDNYDDSDNSSVNSLAYSLDIPEINLKYVGKGPAILKFTIYYNDNENSTSTVQKTITECQPTPTSSGSDKSDLTLQSYGIDRAGIKEGERFNLNLVLLNNGTMPNNHVTAVLDGLSPDEITVDGQLDTKTTDTLQAGETVSLSFPMICNPKMASKNYMLKIQLSSDEAPTATAFNVFVPVTGTKAATESDKPNASKPIIIIENYDYGGQPVLGGKEFNLNMRFKNTNTNTQIENLKITVSSVAGTDDKSVAGAFTPAKSSNTFFISKVGPGANFAEQIALIAKSDATPNSYGVSVAFNYEAVLEGTRQAIEATETISIPLTQPDRFEVNEAEVPGPMYLGQPGQLNINYVNKGKSKIFNLSVKLEGNFTTGESNSYIGNIESGTGDSFQATLNPSAEGTMTGTAVFSYEDANGETKSLTKDFSCEVVPMQDGGKGLSSEPDPLPEAGGSTTPPWWIWLAGGVVIVVAIIAFRIIHKKKKAKKLRLLEESDDYDDLPASGGNQT